jgi:hypothetical protein
MTTGSFSERVYADLERRNSMRIPKLTTNFCENTQFFGNLSNNKNPKNLQKHFQKTKIVEFVALGLSVAFSITVIEIFLVLLFQETF